MLIEVVKALQVAIVMLAGFTAILWYPVAVRIGADATRGHPQIGMNIRLWRILLGCGAVLGISMMGFFPVVFLRMVRKIGIDHQHATFSTIISLFIFYLLILWFASWGRAARMALRESHPHPWDSEEWLRWPYLQYVGIVILIGASLLTLVEGY